jgi:hypothetical protein
LKKKFNYKKFNTKGLIITTDLKGTTVDVAGFNGTLHPWGNHNLGSRGVRTQLEIAVLLAASDGIHTDLISSG